MPADRNCAQSPAQLLGDKRTMRRQERLVGVFNGWNRPQAASAKDIHDALLDAIVVQDLPPVDELDLTRRADLDFDPRGLFRL